MTMGCPSCGSLTGVHHDGCTWEKDHPTVAGVDPDGKHFVVGIYVGTEQPQLEGKRAELRRVSKHDQNWVMATFLDAPATMVVHDYEYDLTRGQYLFKAADFVSTGVDVDPDPLAELARMIGQNDPFISRPTAAPKIESAVDLDQLAKALGQRSAAIIDDQNEAIGRSAFERAPPQMDSATNQLNGDEAYASEVDHDISDTFFCTPEDAALTYAIWDWENSIRLTTPQHFADTYPRALNLHSWLRFHKFTVERESLVVRARVIRACLIAHLVGDIVFALTIMFGSLMGWWQ